MAVSTLLLLDLGSNTDSARRTVYVFLVAHYYTDHRSLLLLPPSVAHFLDSQFFATGREQCLLKFNATNDVRY